MDSIDIRDSGKLFLPVGIITKPLLQYLSFLQPSIASCLKGWREQ
jgi:hypothetical protein